MGIEARRYFELTAALSEIRSSRFGDERDPIPPKTRVGSRRLCSADASMGR
jgi:hypothetical protein